MAFEARSKIEAAIYAHFRLIQDGNAVIGSSQRYYEKKRAEGKRHNQAIRALGRHLCRVILKMLCQKRSYRARP